MSTGKPLGSITDKDRPTETAVHHVETASEKRWKLIGGIVVFCLLCYFSPGFLPFVMSFLVLIGLVYAVHLYREGKLS